MRAPCRRCAEAQCAPRARTQQGALACGRNARHAAHAPQTFEVDEEVANESVTIRNLIEDSGTDELVPLPNVNGKILAKVRERTRQAAGRWAARMLGPWRSSVVTAPAQAVSRLYRPCVVRAAPPRLAPALQPS